MARLIVFAWASFALLLWCGPAAALAAGAAPATAFAPLGARLGGSATVTGTIYDADHVPAEQAWMFAAATTKKLPNGEQQFSMTWGDADPDGTYSLEVPAGWDTWLTAHPRSETSFGRAEEPWHDGETYAGRDFYPGRIAVEAVRGGPWKNFSRLHIALQSPTRRSEDSLETTGTKTTPVRGTIEVLDGSYVEGAATFLENEGLEFSGSWEVTSGATSPTAIVLDEAEAQRISITEPYWGSGNPGIRVEVAFGAFPAGWVNQVGYDSDGKGAVIGTYRNWTSTGAETQTATFRIPAKAEPGFDCWVEARHYNGRAMLELRVPYQVCTMKPSRAVVRAGAKIRVSGVVPIEGHMMDTIPGTPKTVTLYAHDGRVAVPTTWDPAESGWVEVCTTTTDGLGVYRTPLVAVPRTQTFVVRYPGDAENVGAYTSVATVRLKP